jgi:hypothetical protein
LCCKSTVYISSTNNKNIICVTNEQFVLTAQIMKTIIRDANEQFVSTAQIIKKLFVSRMNSLFSNKNISLPGCENFNNNFNDSYVQSLNSSFCLKMNHSS